ncbi:MAG: hypothetical protein HYV63_19005 [Candidatus Schekmanbacteria bacterium]|nr:hypothetical protein [Candidatus Schekmanbacteria bacterium]
MSRDAIVLAGVAIPTKLGFDLPLGEASAVPAAGLPSLVTISVGLALAALLMMRCRGGLATGGARSGALLLLASVLVFALPTPRPVAQTPPCDSQLAGVVRQNVAVYLQLKSGIEQVLRGIREQGFSFPAEPGQKETHVVDDPEEGRRLRIELGNIGGGDFCLSFFDITTQEQQLVGLRFTDRGSELIQKGEAVLKFDENQDGELEGAVRTVLDDELPAGPRVTPVFGGLHDGEQTRVRWQFDKLDNQAPGGIALQAAGEVIPPPDHERKMTAWVTSETDLAGAVRYPTEGPQWDSACFDSNGCTRTCQGEEAQAPELAIVAPAPEEVDPETMPFPACL